MGGRVRPSRPFPLGSRIISSRSEFHLRNWIRSSRPKFLLRSLARTYRPEFTVRSCVSPLGIEFPLGGDVRPFGPEFAPGRCGSPAGLELFSRIFVSRARPNVTNVCNLLEKKKEISKNQFLHFTIKTHVIKEIERDR